MKFGIHLPNMSALSGREPTIRIARRAEELGFDSLWASDHVILPARVESRYPYGRSGVFPINPTANYVDPFISLAVAAGCTERVELGITVLVLPPRNPRSSRRRCSPAWTCWRVDGWTGDPGGGCRLARGGVRGAQPFLLPGARSGDG